jgi:hypothetical protein
MYMTFSTPNALIGVKLWTCIQDVLLRIPGGTPAILTEVFLYFPNPLYANSGMLLRRGHDPFLPDASQLNINQSRYHFTFHNYLTDSDGK